MTNELIEVIHVLGINMPGGTVLSYTDERAYLDDLTKEVKKHIYQKEIKNYYKQKEQGPCEQLIDFLKGMFDKVIERTVQTTFKDYAFVISQNSILYYVNIVFSEIKNEVGWAIKQFYEMKDTEGNLNRAISEEIYYLDVINKEEYILYSQNGQLICESSNEDELEEMVVYIITKNPKNLIVYDKENKLSVEMIICLKKYLEKRTVFINGEYPISKNRNE